MRSKDCGNGLDVIVDPLWDKDSFLCGRGRGLRLRWRPGYFACLMVDDRRAGVHREMEQGSMPRCRVGDVVEAGLGEAEVGDGTVRVHTCWSLPPNGGVVFRGSLHVVLLALTRRRVHGHPHPPGKTSRQLHCTCATPIRVLVLCTCKVPRLGASCGIEPTLKYLTLVP